VTEVKIEVDDDVSVLGFKELLIFATVESTVEDTFWKKVPR
jgi:hypothetical protein